MTSTEQKLGFVIIRHVNSSTTDEYWKESYRCIRKFYNNPILIVDDNSNPQFLKEDIEVVDCQTVKGEFPGAGEILGYYYFHKLHTFDKAVVINDRVFFNKKIDFSRTGEIQFLWSFLHDFDQDKENISLISHLDNCGELVRTYMDKSQWHGCFEIMSVITWDLLNHINERYNFFRTVLKKINTHSERTLLERVYAVVCYTICADLSLRNSALFGNIHDYCRWGFTFDEYKQGKSSDLPLIKVWTYC